MPLLGPIQRPLLLPATGRAPRPVALLSPLLARVIPPTLVGLRPRYVLQQKSNPLPETPIKGRDLGTAEDLAAGIAGLVGVLGPLKVLRVLKTLAPVVIPLSLEEFGAFQFAQKSNRIKSGSEKLHDKFFGTENLNPRPPEKQTYPTLGAQIYKQFLGEAGDTNAGRIILAFFGDEPELPPFPPRGPSPAARTLIPLQPGDLHRLTPQALQKVIGILEARQQLTDQQKKLLAASKKQLADLIAQRTGFGGLLNGPAVAVGGSVDP